jgi:hypothetical protein
MTQLNHQLLDHNSRLDQIEAAFKALGRNIDIEVAAA